MKSNLKSDVIFKAFFSRKGNEAYLIDFLEALLEIRIDKIQIEQEVNLGRMSPKEKSGSLDIQAVLNDGVVVNIHKLNQWLAVIDDRDEGRIKMAIKKNELLKNVKVELLELSGEEETRRIEELKDKWERDYKSGISYAKEEGIEEGLEQGLEQGEKRGLEKGKESKTLEIAKEMLKNGIEIEMVMKCTGLSKREIEQLG